jgi:hypothetical protein
VIEVSFAAEVEKIAVDVLSKQEQKEKERIEQGRKSIPTRVAMMGAGLGMATGNIPLVAKALAPSPTVYHGTTLESAEKVLNVPVQVAPGEPSRGLLTRFAGKAGRLNEKLLANAFAEITEKHKIDMSGDDVVEFVLGTNERMSMLAKASKDPERFADEAVEALKEIPAWSKGTWEEQSRLYDRLHELPWDSPESSEIRKKLALLRKLDSWNIYSAARNLPGWEERARAAILSRARGARYDASEIVESSAREFLSRKGVPKEKLDAAIGDLSGLLKERGKRIYFGWHPSTVAVWGKKGSELELYGQKLIGEFAESPGAKTVFENLRSNLQGYMPPGFKVPETPKFHAAEDFDDLERLAKKWVSDVLDGAGKQAQANLASGVSADKALGRLPDLMGIDPRDFTDALSGDSQAAERIAKSAKSTGEGIYSGPLGDIFKDFTDDTSRAVRSFMARKGLKSALDVATFGIIPEVRTLAAAARYRPETTREMTPDEAGKHLKNLLASGQKRQVVFGARVPGGSLRWMKDFPFLAPLMSVNPGLKHTVSEFLPNFDPSRDISIATDVPLEHLQSMDVINPETGKFERILLKGATKPSFKFGRFLKGLGVAAPFAAIGALGVDLLQAGVRGKKTATESLFAGELSLRPSKKDPLVRRWQRTEIAKSAMWSELEKVSASAAAQLAARVAKAAIPAVGVGGAMGFGAEKAVQHILPAEKALEKEEPARSAYLGTRSGMAGLGAAAGTMGVISLLNQKLVSEIKDALEKGKIDRKAMKGFGAKLAKLYGLATLGMTAASSAASITDAIRRGQPPHALSVLNLPLSHPRGREVVEKAPQVGAAIPLATVAGLPILAAYAGRRYYPGHFLAVGKAMESKLDPILYKAHKAAYRWLKREKGVPAPQLLRSAARRKAE